MQLITNKISTGKPGRFEDFIKKFKASQVKTASMKTAEEQDEAESSGQLKVEPLHQTGESTTMPKNGPSAKKDDGEKAATVNTDTEKDGEDSGQPKAEGSEKFTNDPKVPTKEEKGGSSDAKTKVAGKCEDCGCPSNKCECEEPCKACTARAKATKKTAALEDLPQAVQDKIKGKKTDDSDDDDGDTKPAADADDDGDSDVEAKEEDKETKEASHKCDDCDCDPCTCKDKKASKSVKFVKWANLDSKNKSFLMTYWRQLFGDDYVNALVSDK